MSFFAHCRTSGLSYFYFSARNWACGILSRTLAPVDLLYAGAVAVEGRHRARAAPEQNSSSAAAAGRQTSLRSTASSGLTGTGADLAVLKHFGRRKSFTPATPDQSYYPPPASSAVPPTAFSWPQFLRSGR